MRRRVYYAAAVAVLLVAFGLGLRTVDGRWGGQPEVGAAVSADAGLTMAVASAGSAGAAGAVGSALAPTLEHTFKPVLKPEVMAVRPADVFLPAATAQAEPVDPAGAERSSCGISEIPPLRGGCLPIGRLESAGPAPVLLACVFTETAAAGLSEEVETRRPRFEPNALIAQTYVAVARRIERQRIRREIKREVTASLRVDVETRPAFWNNIYN